MKVDFVQSTRHGGNRRKILQMCLESVCIRFILRTLGVHILQMAAFDMQFLNKTRKKKHALSPIIEILISIKNSRIWLIVDNAL
jgi:hypothetical protein